MSKYKFFAYDPETGFETFETAEQAKKHAEECIDWYRGESIDGWDEQIDQVCWGEIKAKATQVGLRKSTEDDETCCDMYCDYELKDVMQEQQHDR